MSSPSPMILVLGGPGSGKSTVSNIIQTNIKESSHLKTGQIMRNLITTAENIPSMDKEEVNTTMQSGGLIKDEVVCEFVQKEIARLVSSKQATRFVLDGFPRTNGQLKCFLDSQNYQIAVAFILVAPHSIMEKRCKMRNLRTDRVDDRKGPVEHRINDFLQHVSPISDVLKSKKIPMVNVDTCEPMEKMTQKIVENLKNLKLI